MDLFERLEKEMEGEKAEVADTKAAAQILVWVFVLCAVVLMVAGTARLLMVWF
jgi:hypothetical protein